MRILVRLDILGIVLITCKPDQALIEDVDTPRVHAGDKDIKSDIELEPIDEQRVVNVPRDNAWLVNGHL